MTEQQTPTVSSSWHIRWMIRRDLPEVLLAEKLGGSFRWNEGVFLEQLAARNVIGMVAERNGLVCGFMVYVLHEKRLQLSNLVVHPEWCGSGAGSTMIEKLKGKLSSHRRVKLRANVPEHLTRLQVFLGRHGFRAVRSQGGVYRMEFVFEDANVEAET